MNPSLRQSSAYDYHKDVGLIMVGGELCTNEIWCNDYTNRTILSQNGTVFEDLAPFPELLKGHCAVFLDKFSLMVIAGYDFPKNYHDGTFILNINNNVWRSGPPLNHPRAYHTCNVVTDCDGKQQVVVVGGLTPGPSTNPTNSVEIYDVESGAWSLGNLKI